MKKWIYDGDIDCRHGGSWFKTSDLLSMDDMVETVTVTPLDGDIEVYLIETGYTYISHKQEVWIGVGLFADWAEEMAHFIETENVLSYWHMVTVGFASYAGIQADDGTVVAIGKDAPNRVGRLNVRHRLRSDAKLENYIYKHFLKGA